MAVDKLVDSTQLDSDLTSIADAIRTKGGTSASLAFPAGFVSAINAISGGGDPNENFTLFLQNRLTSIEIDMGNYGLVAVGRLNGSALKHAKFTNVGSTAFNIGNYMFYGAALNDIVIIFNLVSSAHIASFFVGSNTALTAVDLTNCSDIDTNAFNGCSKLYTLILRKPSIVALGNVTAFNGTPFKSGGTGGTIYIPKSLYDHLGDGTADDYKAATNWSTVEGYGTITWAKIEGSIYENAYAGGTPIE